MSKLRLKRDCAEREREREISRCDLSGVMSQPRSAKTGKDSSSSLSHTGESGLYRGCKSLDELGELCDTDDTPDGRLLDPAEQRENWCAYLTQRTSGEGKEGQTLKCLAKVTATIRAGKTLRGVAPLDSVLMGDLERWKESMTDKLEATSTDLVVALENQISHECHRAEIRKLREEQAAASKQLSSFSSDCAREKRPHIPLVCETDTEEGRKLAALKFKTVTKEYALQDKA